VHVAPNALKNHQICIQGIKVLRIAGSLTLHNITTDLFYVIYQYVPSGIFMSQ
jgi:hypothetical protein